MRICIDIDGTICPIRENSQAYKDLEPYEGAAQKIKALRQQGYYIIFNTARHMKTCNSNVGQVIAREGLNLLNWLKDHDFEYDEIWFGKPIADIYIDDKALQFKGSWGDIDSNLINSYV